MQVLVLPTKLDPIGLDTEVHCNECCVSSCVELFRSQNGGAGWPSLGH